MKCSYLLLPFLFFLSCVPAQLDEKEKSDLEFEDKPRSNGRFKGRSAFLKAQEVLNSRCLNCHGVSATNWGVRRNSSESEWIENTPAGLIIPSNSKDSSLVKLMLYSTGGTMPLRQTKDTFSREEYLAITKWIDGLDLKNSEEEPEEEVTIGDPIFQKKGKLLLGDRNYVAKKLKNIFGHHDSLVQKIRSKVIVFGGPCPEGHGWSGNKCLILDEAFDMNADDSYEGSKEFLNQKFYISVDLATSSAAVNPESSPVREGYRTEVCEELLFGSTYEEGKKNYLLNAIATVKSFEGLSTSRLDLDFSVYPRIDHNYSDSEISAAYQLFHNFKKPSVKEVTALKEIAIKAQTLSLRKTNNFPLRFEPWRYMLYSLCDSPQWQIK